jgi:hypothetical protein
LCRSSNRDGQLFITDLANAILFAVTCKISFPSTGTEDFLSFCRAMVQNIASQNKSRDYQVYPVHLLLRRGSRIYSSNFNVARFYWYLQGTLHFRRDLLSLYSPYPPICGSTLSRIKKMHTPLLGFGVALAIDSMEARSRVCISLSYSRYQVQLCTPSLAPETDSTLAI